MYVTIYMGLGFTLFTFVAIYMSSDLAKQTSSFIG
jgi:hypothetical protein